MARGAKMDGRAGGRVRPGSHAGGGGGGGWDGVGVQPRVSE